MRRALCVGVDRYSFGNLNGCVRDAERVSQVLKTNHDGSPNFDARTLLARQSDVNNVVTRVSLKAGLEKLFKDPADVVLFHFSGHGTVNSLDGYLVTQDAQKYDEGMAMADVLKLANDSKARDVVILLDCCFSGNLGNWNQGDNSKSLLREGVSILTAGRGDQVSVETGGGGVFTSLVVDALEGGAANLLGTVSAPAVYAFAEAALGAWDQRPLLKAHVSGLVDLRCSTPPIERAVLRRLPALFPLPAEDHPLDPSYEHSSSAFDPGRGLVFDDLQALNRVYLVVPIGADHMYDAAMKSGSCRLTASGRYYWRLASGSKI